MKIRGAAVAAATVVGVLSWGWSQKNPPPDYFPLPKGATWDYESTTDAGKKFNFNVTVTEVTKETDGSQRFCLRTDNGFQPIDQFFSKPDGWVLEHREVYVKNNMVADFKPVRRYLQNPLASGASWSWSGTGMMDVAIEDSASVTGPETVVVPAGTFSAFHVVSKVTQGGQPVQKDYWYANHVGQVKSMTDSGSVKSTTVLLRYKFPK
jgi:hypothetical protein